MGMGAASRTGVGVSSHAQGLASSPVPYILLDRDGIIRSSSDPLEGHSLSPGPPYLGTDYLENCQASGSEGGRVLAAGIRKVLAGQPGTFWVPCPWCQPPKTPA